MVGLEEQYGATLDPGLIGSRFLGSTVFMSTRTCERDLAIHEPEVTVAPVQGPGVLRVTRLSYGRNDLLQRKARKPNPLGRDPSQLRAIQLTRTLDPPIVPRPNQNQHAFRVLALIHHALRQKVWLGVQLGPTRLARLTACGSSLFRPFGGSRLDADRIWSR